MMSRYPITRFFGYPTFGLAGAALRAAQRRAKAWFSKDEFGVSYWDIQRLQFLRSQQRASLRILGKPVQLTDGYWGSHCYREIFCGQIYRFRARTSVPVILDCGSNVGLSLIYFKYIYPNAHVIAFEPDPQIFRVLESNLRNFEFSDVELHQKAVWMTGGHVPFRPDGSVGGTILDGIQQDTDLRVPATRLKEWLARKVDFLKLDIEGAELEVLTDCQGLLGNVEYLFVEYHSQANKRQTLHDLLGILHSAGFRYHLKDANPIGHPFLKQERRKGFDLQTNIFGFRN